MEQLTCDALNVLNEALCHEEEGRVFYIKAAERTADPKGAEMFRTLAEGAQHHVSVIERQIDALTNEKVWALPECVFECSVDLEKPLYPQDRAGIAKTIPVDAGERDAILFALQTETESFSFYAGHAKDEDDPNAKRLYEYLAEQARQHFDLLMLNYEGAGSQVTWSD